MNLGGLTLNVCKVTHRVVFIFILFYFLMVDFTGQSLELRVGIDSRVG